MARLNDKHLKYILEVFKLVSGNELPESKKHMIESRLNRRLYQLGIDSFDKYLYILQRFPKEEVPHLISLLTTHHTKFFRENVHIDYLINELLPKHFQHSAIEYFRVWCAASSTGEEPYSIAMALDAFCRNRGILPNYEVFATDIDRIAVSTGEKGIYPMDVYSSIPDRYQRLCTRKEKGPDPFYFKIRDEVASRIRWSTFNLKSESFQIEYGFKFDVVFVRNVFIYFTPKEVEHAVSQFTKFMKPKGKLIIGLSENLANIRSRFTLKQNAIYELQEDAKTGAAQGPNAATTAKVIPITSAPPSASSSSPAPAAAMATSSNKIRLMVVDDSKTIHILMKSVLANYPDIEIVAEAFNGVEALEVLKKTKIDVITCDIHMPEMDGIAFLQEQMKQYRIPTLMISSISPEDGMHLLRAADYGAVGYVQKPSMGSIEDVSAEIVAHIRTASGSMPMVQAPVYAPNVKVGAGMQSSGDKLILIGASTGGPDAISYVLKQMTKSCPPIVIVQHMPAVVTKAFAERLSKVVEPEVKEGYDNDFIMPGHVYIAPGDRHIKIKEIGGALKIMLSNEAPVDQHKPSVDILFRSVLPYIKKYQTVAVMLTGMGRDGAAAMKLLHDAGVKTIGQDQATSVVYGMARTAQELGAIDCQCPLQQIPGKIFEAFEKPKKPHKKVA